MKIQDMLFNLYKMFDSGYDFEKFLKKYFEKLGLIDVVVTQKSRDGGIDLIGYHEGIDKENKQDIQKYIIQAKRYLPNSPIGVSVIRELKGVLKLGEVGIVVTTGFFTSEAIEESSNNSLHPVILIDGMKLLKSYDFNFDNKDINYDLFGNNEISTQITSEEIREGVLFVPNEFVKYLPQNMENINVLINGSEEVLKYDELTQSFIEMENYFEKYHIVDGNTFRLSATLKWKYCNGMISLDIVF